MFVITQQRSPSLQFKAKKKNTGQANATGKHLMYPISKIDIDTFYSRHAQCLQKTLQKGLDYQGI